MYYIYAYWQCANQPIGRTAAVCEYFSLILRRVPPKPCQSDGDAEKELQM